jgi:tungstate transport system ATP-binding protein
MLPLTLENVTYRAGGRVLIDSVSAQFTAGPRTMILGANGAGKSVLMRLCHGLLNPAAGVVRWQGVGRQAMVFQRPVMLRRSALGNVIYALRLAGMAKHAAAARANEVMAAVGLGELARRPARVLSGGEQQRLALARAWALAPKVLFLDEPTANLDPRATHDIEQIIGRLHAEGVKIIMSTHSLGQARRLGDEVIFLDEGRIVERADCQTFFHAPRTAAAQAFLNHERP